MVPRFVNSFFQSSKKIFRSPQGYPRNNRPILLVVMEMKGFKEFLLAAAGGSVYVLLELLWRGRSHWTMFVLGGVCFWLIVRLNRSRTMPLALQACLGAMVVTGLELLTGLLVNRVLDWGVWDYSSLPMNFQGQICLYFFVLWIPVSAAAAMAGSWLRHRLFGEPVPRFRLVRWSGEPAGRS